MQFSNFAAGMSPAALACFLQHNKHKDFLHQTMAGYVAAWLNSRQSSSLYNIFLILSQLAS